MTEDDGSERRKSYMEKFVHWAEKSSFHAVPQMVISKNYLVKLLWLCCLILSTYACGKTVVTNLIDYFSYSVDTVLELDRDGQATFPTVTICRLQICGLDSQEYSKFLDGFLQQQEQNLNFTEPDVSEMLDLFRDYFLTNYNKTELNHIFGNKSSKSIKDSLITCLYDGLECSADDFAFFQLDEFQACYSFNTGRNSSGQEVEVRQVRRFGKNYGLHLELFMGLPDDCKTPLSPNFGLVVYVHNASYVIWDENNGFEATPGYETDVAVDRTRLIKLPDPYSNCILNTEPPKNMDDFSQALRDTFAVTQSYTQQTCLQMCYQRFLADRYKCYDPSLPFINRPGLQTCTNAINSLTNSIYTDKADFYKEKSSQCLLDCPLECDSYTYKATLSNTEFPSLSYADLLEMKKNLTAELNMAGNSNNNIDDQKKNGFLSLNVFYKSDLITTITERPQTELEAFISELGGTLGLFLGISFLSFIELVEIVLEFILIKYDKVVLSKNRVHVIKVVPPMPDNKSSPKKTESTTNLFVKSKTVL